jgi:hypothetical protein
MVQVSRPVVSCQDGFKDRRPRRLIQPLASEPVEVIPRGGRSPGYLQAVTVVTLADKLALLSFIQRGAVLVRTKFKQTISVCRTAAMAPYSQAVDAAFSEKPNLKASIHEAICTMN